ncbi:hypothetical protein N9383_03370 [Granulosicoccus sp.]|nr:hypothetical protein [Granulosicoccus sp.]
MSAKSWNVFAGLFPVPHYRQKRLELTDQGMVRYALEGANRDEAISNLIVVSALVNSLPV